jgi:hypothetical protein
LLFAELGFFRQMLVVLRSVFTGKSRDEVIVSDVLKQLLQEIRRQSPNMIDAGRAMLLPDFFAALERVQRIAQFFATPVRKAFGKRKPEFIAVLAGLEMPEARQQLISETDPFVVASAEDERSDYEIKQQLWQNLEHVFSFLPPHGQEAMDDDVLVLGVLHELVEFDFDAVLGVAQRPGSSAGWDGSWSAESSTGTGDPSRAESSSASLEAAQSAGERWRAVPISELSEHLIELAGILKPLEGVSVSVTPLEALTLFSHDQELDRTDQSFHTEVEKQVRRGMEQFQLLVEFLGTVRLFDLARYAAGDVNYVLQAKSGGENWRSLLRAFWTDRIERFHQAFRMERERMELAETVSEGLQARPEPDPSYPAPSPLPYGKHALSVRVLQQFAEEVFEPVLVKPLQVLRVEGAFYKQANREEFDAAFEGLQNLAQAVGAVKARFGEDGETRRAIAAAEEEVTRDGRDERVRKAIDALDEEAEALVRRTADQLRSISEILYGILYGEVGSQYDTLENLGDIGGRGHETLMRQFDAAQDKCRFFSEQVYRLLDLENKIARRLSAR